MKLFNQKSVKEIPIKSGWYDTDKGKLYWFLDEGENGEWSCRDDRVSEEYPSVWYQKVVKLRVNVGVPKDGIYKYKFKCRSMKTALRILFIPIVALIGLFMLAAGTMFPITLIVFLHLFCLIGQPFVWLINCSLDTKIKNMEPLYFLIGKSDIVQYLLGATIHLWFVPYYIYYYLKNGKLLDLS
jgi:hypothetical protein